MDVQEPGQKSIGEWKKIEISNTPHSSSHLRQIELLLSLSIAIGASVAVCGSESG